MIHHPMQPMEFNCARGFSEAFSQKGELAFYGTAVLNKVQDTDDPEWQKVPLVFYRTAPGSEPVKEWLRFIKKTRTTPDEDLAIVRKRQKELER